MELSTAKEKPWIWERHVDDTCVMEEEHVNNLLDHLNKQCHTIMGKEENRSLPFLDTLLRREDGRLHIGVYRKPTRTERYLHHPTHVQIGVASCLFHRARTIAAGDIRREEHMEGPERQWLP